MPLARPSRWCPPPASGALHCAGTAPGSAVGGREAPRARRSQAGARRRGFGTLPGPPLRREGSVTAGRPRSGPLVARRRPLPDLPPLLRRLQRRRRGRPAGHHRPSSTTWPSLGIDRRVALPGHRARPTRDWGYDVAGLLRHRPRLRDPRRPRHAGARGGGRGASGSSWTWCPTTPATNTRGSSTRSAGATRRTGTTTSGPTPAGREPAQQLDERLRRAGLDLDEASGQYYLHNFEAASSPTSTGGTRTSATPSTTSCASGGTAAWRASASTCAT